MESVLSIHKMALYQIRLFQQTPAKFLYMCDAVTTHKSVDDKHEDLYDKYIIIDTEKEAVDNDMIPESELLAFSSPPWPAEPSEDGQQDFDNGIWQIHQRKDPWQRIIKETNNICIQEWHQYKGPS